MTDATLVGSLVPRLLAGLREYVWVLVGAVAAILGGFVGVRVLTEYVAPEAYGEMSLGLTVSTVVNQSLYGPLSAGLARFHMAAAEAKDRRRYWRTTWRMVASWGALATTLFALAPLALGLAGVVVPLRAYCASVLFALASGVHTVLAALQTAERARAAAALHQVGFHLGRYAFAVGLVVAFAREAWVAMLGFGLGTLIVVLSETWMLWPREAPQVSAGEDPWEERVRGYTLPMVGWGVFTMLQSSADRWSLAYFDSAATLGIYAIVYQLGFYSVGLAVGTVNQFVIPILIQRAGDGTDERRLNEARALNDRMFVGLAACLVAGTLLAWPLSGPIFDVLAAERYRVGAPWLPLAMSAASLHALGQVLSNQWMLGKDTRALLVPKVVTSVVGAGLFFVTNAISPGVSSTLWAWLAYATLYLLVLAGMRLTSRPSS